MALGTGAAIADNETGADVVLLTSVVGLKVRVALGRADADREVADVVLWRAASCP